MMKSLMFIFLLYPLASTAYITNVISVVQFGAKGDGVTDNTAALTKAFQYCAKNNVICYIPKFSKSYIINGTVHVSLLGEEHLTIKSDGATIELGKPKLFKNYLIYRLTSEFREIALLSFGPSASAASLQEAFKNQNKSSIRLSGLIFKGDNVRFSSSILPGQTIMSALDISVDSASLNNLSFYNIKGYGLRSFGARYLRFTDLQMHNVGGRGKVPETDAFGDGIYICVLKNDATVQIDKCKLIGALVKNKRSRDGITFEFSTKSYKAKISNTVISQFAKSIHVEDKATAIIKVKECNFGEFNYCVAMVANKNSVLNIFNSNLNCSGTDGVDKGDGGPTINTDTGGIINFYNTTIDLNQKKRSYITMVGVDLMQNCIIDGNNENPYFADGFTTFKDCRFVNFGGSNFSFYAFGKNISSFNILNCKFSGGGPVNAKGQRVNLQIKGSASNKPLTPQNFNR